MPFCKNCESRAAIQIGNKFIFLGDDLMTKHTTVALAITAFAFAPLAAFAFADKQEVENYCQQEAMAKGIPADKVADYVANCVTENMKADKELEGEEKTSE